jgi:hypothetical protein
MKKIAFLICLFLFIFSINVYSKSDYTEENIDLIIKYASLSYDIPAEIIHIIGHTESSSRLWVVNFGGKSKEYPDQESMIKGIKSSSASNYDVGFMQINSFWIRKYGFELKDITDPYYNIMMGAWILRDCINRHGNNMTALVAYHTNPANKNLGERYVRQLMRSAESVLSR